MDLYVNKYNLDDSVSQLDFILAFYNEGIVKRFDYNRKEQKLSSHQLISDEVFLKIDAYIQEEAAAIKKKKKTIQNYYSFKGLIPKNVISYSENKYYIIWVTEKSKEKHLFTTRAGVKTGIYPIPRLLWKMDSESLWIYALKEHDEINEETILYNAPFMNISSNGLVCLGTVKLMKTEDYQKFIDNVYYQFFNSYFTHTNNDKLLKMNYTTFLKQNVNQDYFNDELLIPSEKTKLKNILK